MREAGPQFCNEQTCMSCEWGTEQRAAVHGAATDQKIGGSEWTALTIAAEASSQHHTKRILIVLSMKCIYFHDAYYSTINCKNTKAAVF